MNNKSSKHTKVLIIGSGPAGYTAAIYAARALLKPILVSGAVPGGQLTTTTDVENFPGFSKVIQGPWLMEEMKGQAKAVGTEMIQDHISKVNLKKNLSRHMVIVVKFIVLTVLLFNRCSSKMVKFGLRSKNLEALEFQLAQLVTDFFLKTKKSQLLVEEMQPLKKLCFSLNLRQR